MNIQTIIPFASFANSRYGEYKNKTPKHISANPVTTQVSLLQQNPPVSAKLALVSFYGTRKNNEHEEHKTIKPAKRLSSGDYKISKYIAEIGKARYLHGDRAVMDLSMGNPDLTPPEKAKQALKDKVNDLWSHRYNNPKGDGYFFHTAADWFKRRFGVTIDPRKEIMVTSGSSDAIDHIFSAYAEYGDKVLVPDPGYSLYDDLITRHDLIKVPYKLYPQNGSLRRGLWAGVHFPGHYRLLRQPPGAWHASVCRGYD